jgi:hypothetical protein
MSQTDTPFNPNEHLMQLKTKEGFKDYLAVQWRLVWFRELCPQGIILTKEVFLDPQMDTEEEGFAWNEEKRKSERVMKHGKGFAVFHAHVEDGKGGMAEGTKSEKAAAFADYIEKAETGAIGRALAALGYGTQFAPDFEGDVADNPVDSPVSRANGERAQISQAAAPAMATQASPKPTPARQEPDLAATNHAKVEALLDEYKRLRPEQCSAQGWYRKVLREVWHTPEGVPLPASRDYTPEHVIALAQYVIPWRLGAEAPVS